MSTKPLAQRHDDSVGMLVAVLCIAVIMALRLPIYPDEVAYRILLERFFQSGGYKTSITPYCAEGFQVVPAHFLKLSAIFWSALSLINSSIVYRVIPATLLVLSLGSLYWFSKRQGMRAKPWLLLLFVPGVSIYGLVILRPEIFIAVSIVTLAIFGLYIAKAENVRPNVSLLIAVCVTAIFIIVSYVHPKALYLLLPVVIILGLIVEKVIHSPMRVASLAALTIIVLITAYDAVQLHGLGYAGCKDFPEIQTTMNSLNVNIFDVFRDSSKFISNLSMANDNVRYDRTFSQLSFRGGYDIGVLPSVPELGPVNLIILGTVLATFAYVTLIILLNAIKSVRTRKIEREFLVYLAISAAAGCQFFFNIPKNWYDISLSVFSLGVLAFIGAGISRLESGKFFAKGVDKAIQQLQSIFIFVALVSLGVNYQVIYRSFQHGYVGPGISIQTPLAKLQVFAQTHYQPDYENVAQPIVVDDLTYHMFHRHAKVYPVTYLMLNAQKYPATLDVVLAGGSLTGITRCALLTEFDAIRKTTLIDRVTFTEGPNYSVDICKWTVR